MSKRQCKQCGSKSQEEAKAKCFRAAYDYCIFHALPKVSEPSAGAVKVSAQHRRKRQQRAGSTQGLGKDHP